MTSSAASPIPLPEAMRLCDEISPVKLRRWWDPLALQCRGCIRFSSDAEHRCFAATTGNRGCRFINERWDQELKIGA